jgi:hypothetical protein
MPCRVYRWYTELMDSKPYDIVLLPENSIANLACEVSDSLKPHGVLFTLKEGEFYPHMSLYMVQLKASSLDDVKQQLVRLASENNVFKLNAFEYHQEWGYIDVEYSNIPNAADLQMRVVKAINPLRDGLRVKDQVRLETAEGLEFQNILDFGYRSIGELFSPHITLTRFESEEPVSTDELPKIKDFDATFTKLAIFEMGDNGTCVKKLFEVSLKNQSNQ